MQAELGFVEQHHARQHFAGQIQKRGEGEEA